MTIGLALYRDGAHLSAACHTRQERLPGLGVEEIGERKLDPEAVRYLIHRRLNGVRRNNRRVLVLSSPEDRDRFAVVEQVVSPIVADDVNGEPVRPVYDDLHDVKNMKRLSLGVLVDSDRPRLE